MAVQGDDFVCLSDDDGPKHIDSLLKSKYTAKDMGTLGFEDSDVRSFLLLNRVFRVGADQTGQYLDVEPDLRHAPLIISEPGCNVNTEAVSTLGEKLQDKLVLDGRRSLILNKDETTRYRFACMRLSHLSPRQIRSVGNSETFRPEDERALRIQFYPVETCSAISGGKAQSSAKISKTETCGHDHSLRGQRLCWRPSLEEEHDGTGSSDW